MAPGPPPLLADGTTTTRPGTWPALEFELTAVAGRDNRLERPVYLLPLETQNLLCVDATTGGTLTLPEVPDFALTVEAGSATFPGGTQAGCISVTPVHADKVPMTPNFGQQPRFIVTIQPAGVVFDPPAPLSLPNTDGLAPGAVTELYSFDHDLGRFVAIGTATVSGDGTTVASDPGVGIVKSGWASGGDPDDTGEAENVFVSFSPPPAIFLSGGPVSISAAGGPLPGSFSWSGGNSSLSLGVSSSSSVTVTPVAPGTAQVSVSYTAQSGKSSPTATATVTVVDAEFQTAIAGALPSPLRLGISVGANDRTQKLKVVVSPEGEAANFTVSSSAAIDVSNIDRIGNEINFDVKGIVKSDSVGDQAITVTHSSGVTVTHPVSVVVPGAIATPHDVIGSGVFIQNVVANETTLPAAPFPADVVVLITAYGRILTITVVDQFGNLAGDLYGGAAVTENGLPLNQTLSSGSTYSDFAGRGAIHDPPMVVAPDSPEALAWPNEPLLVPPPSIDIQATGVEIDGFPLDPAVENRLVKISPPAGTVEIIWP